MDWFAIWHPHAGHAEPGVEPVRGRCLDGAGRVWTVGAWPAWKVRVRYAGPYTVTCLGACLATDAELDAAIDIGRRRGDWTSLAALCGSFLTVACRPGETVIVPDLAGQHTVYWMSTDEGGWVTSIASPLVALTGAVPDADWLAARLVCSGMVEVSVDRSAYVGIQQLQPGHMLRLDHRVESIPLPVRRQRLGLVEGAEAFGAALGRSIQRRVERTATISGFCSGGMDSSTLVALTAPRLPKSMLAVTHLDPFSNNSEDVRYAEHCVQAVPNIEQVIVTSDRRSLPFTGPAADLHTSQPTQEALFLARTRLLLEPVIAAGTQMHLCGDGGDALLTAPLIYLADLAGQRRYGRLWQEATGWARMRNLPAYQLLWSALATRGVGPGTGLAAITAVLRDTARPRRRERGHRDRMSLYRASPAAGWLTRHAADRIADHLDTLATGQRRETGRAGWAGMADAACLHAVRANADSARVGAELTAALGVDVQTPFFDNNVVRAAAAVAAIDRTTMTRAKPLLATAMAGRVPAPILQRSTKGDYTPAHYAGFRHNAETLATLLSRPRLADLGIVEPAPVQRALRNATMGIKIPIAALADVLATELWLRQPRPSLSDHWTKQPQPAAAGAARARLDLPGGHR